MFTNYLKLAFKVLGRRKFFTFVSLFGISFTLMVLMVIMAFLDTELGANAPMTNADRMVLIDRLELKKDYFDTIYQVDSNLIAGEWQLDTTGFDTEEAGRSISTSNPGFHVIDKHLKDAEPYEMRTILFDRGFDVFQDGRKYNLRALYTDKDYWNILDFNFEEGEPINPEQVASAASVVVVTNRLAKELFGSESNVVGKTIPLSGRSYEVVGVVSRTRSSSSFIAADIYLPYTTADERMFNEEEVHGPWRAIYLSPTVAQTESLKDALSYKGSVLPLPPDLAADYDQVKVYAYSAFEKYSWDLFGGVDTGIEESVFQFRMVLFFLLGFFILIPTLNLINLNLSRMMERASEIGVRKSFGANSSQVLIQFLFENVIITLIGGLIGFVLALLVIRFINESGALPDSILSFNWRVFGLSFLLCLVFGILSGLLPAWRMSRMHIVKGLNS